MRRRAVGKSPLAPPEYTAPPVTPATPTHPDVTHRQPKQKAERKKLQVTYASGKISLKYGRHLLPGEILYSFDRPTRDEFWYVIGYCKGEAEGLQKIIKDKQQFTPPATSGPTTVTSLAGGWQIWFYTGSSSQVADTNLGAIDSSWTASPTAEHLKNACYAVVKLSKVSSKHPQLPNFLFEIKTKKCIIPSTQVEAYSEYPADQFYDWLRQPEGKNLRKSRINTASFIAASATCAELVSGGARYTSHPSIEGQDVSDVEKIFALMCDGIYFYSRNQFFLVLDRPATSVATYTDAHFARDQEAKGWREDPTTRVNQVIIEYTDVANGWKLIPARIETAAVTAKREHPRPATYKMDWLHDPAVVQRALNYLLACYTYDFKLELKHLASTSDRQVGEVITQSVAARGISGQMFRIMDRVKSATDNTFNDLLLEYNAGRYSNAVATVPAKISSTLPDLGANLDVDLATVSWAEQLYPEQGGDWRTRGVLGMTLPTFSFFDAIEVWVSINGGASYYWFETTSVSSITPVLFETGTYTLTLKTRHKITKELSAGTVIAVPVNGVSGTPPEVVDFYCDMGADNPAILHFGAPRVRVNTLFGSGFWSNGAGLTAFDGSKVSNGNTSDVPFTNALGSTPTVQWSDTAASGPWTSPAPQNRVTMIGTGTGYQFRTWSASAHRWWSLSWSGGAQRLVFDAGVGSTRTFRELLLYRNGSDQVTDVQLLEYGAEVQGVLGYRLYSQEFVGGLTIESVAVPLIEAIARPTSSVPLFVEQFAQRVTTAWNSGGYQTLNLRLAVVSMNGVESAGVVRQDNSEGGAAGGPAPYLPQTQTNVALTVSPATNGAISTPAGPGGARFTSSGAARLDGITVSAGAVMPCVNACGGVLTIKNDSASAADVTYRILTPTGADVSVPAGATFWLVFDTAAGRWRFQGMPWSAIASRPTTLAGYGITDAAPIASPAFTNVPTAPTAAPGTNTAQLATTAFVAAAGGGMPVTSNYQVPTSSGTVTSSATAPPAGATYTESTNAGTTHVDHLNITGKGALVFLGTGGTTGGSTACIVTITVDGVILGNFNLRSVSVGGSTPTATCLNCALVGAIATTTNGSNLFLAAIPDAEGITFNVSLRVQFKRSGSGTAYIGSIHKRYV